MRTRFFSLVLLGVVLLWLNYARGGKDDDPKHADDKDHVVVTPDKIKWAPGPAWLPPGAEVAALVGDPAKKGPYTVRVKFPDGYKVPSHWHPHDENVTVIQGALHIGRGDKFDRDATQELPAGSDMRMPKGARHFAWFKGETILQGHGEGLFEIHYVNATDDPRKKDDK
jgi:quercetin dioxygenase-like cupin family protein